MRGRRLWLEVRQPLKEIQVGARYRDDILYRTRDNTCTAYVCFRCDCSHTRSRRPSSIWPGRNDRTVATVSQIPTVTV
jgi:hypothetical protein